jgi:putative ABC transport system permease protein
LVVLQVALSLVLLAGAGLFLRSLHNLKSVDPGLDPERLAVVTIEPGLSGYSVAATQVLFDRLVERARTMPGVIVASPGLISPLSGSFSMAPISVPGYQPRPNESPFISSNWVGLEYFKTLATPLVSGRVFTEQDGRTNNVAIVNEEAAAHFWPRESPLGKHFDIGGRSRGIRESCEIVGVVKDVKSEWLREDAKPTVYMPFRKNGRPHLTLHVRVAGETTPVIAALNREIRTLDPNLLVSDATTMAKQIDRTIAPRSSNN